MKGGYQPFHPLPTLKKYPAKKANDTTEDQSTTRNQVRFHLFEEDMESADARNDPNEKKSEQENLH